MEPMGSLKHPKPEEDEAARLRVFGRDTVQPPTGCPRPSARFLSRF